MPLPDPGLVLHIPMEEGAGTTVYDASRYGNNGAVNGGIVWDERGMRFDGSTGYLDCGNDDSLQLYNDITLSAWTNLLSVSSADTMFGTKFNRTDHTAPYNIHIFSGAPRFIMGTGTGWLYTSYSDLLTTDKWYHLVATIEGTSMKMYVDSIHIGSQTFAGTRQSLEKVTIGHDGDSRWLPGSISDVRIYNRALSAAEIKRQYKREVHNYV